MFTLSDNFIGANFAKTTQPATPQEQFVWLYKNALGFIFYRQMMSQV